MPLWESELKNVKEEEVIYFFTDDISNLVNAAIMDKTNYINDLTSSYTSTASGGNLTTKWRVIAKITKKCKIYSITIHPYLLTTANLNIYRNGNLIHTQSVNAGDTISLNIYADIYDEIIFEVIGSGTDFHYKNLSSNDNMTVITQYDYGYGWVDNTDTILTSIKSKAYEEPNFYAENGYLISKINSPNDIKLFSEHSKLYSLVNFDDIQISMDGSNFVSVKERPVDISFPFWLKAIFSDLKNTKAKLKFL